MSNEHQFIPGRSIRISQSTREAMQRNVAKSGNTLSEEHITEHEDGGYTIRIDDATWRALRRIHDEPNNAIRLCLVLKKETYPHE